jgi:hypothetical protein
MGQMNEPPGARMRVGLSALTIAEYFREELQQDHSQPAYSVAMTPVRDTQLVIDRTTLYWGLLTLLVLAILFSSYLVG